MSFFLKFPNNNNNNNNITLGFTAGILRGWAHLKD